MTIVQKWLSGLIGLGAVYLVVVHPEGFYKGAMGLKNLTAGSIATVTTGGAK